MANYYFLRPNPIQIYSSSIYQDAFWQLCSKTLIYWSYERI